MTQAKIIVALFFGAAAFLACNKDEHDFLRDNTTTTSAGYIPISNNTLQDVTANPVRNLGTSSGTATVYPAGATFRTELTFFSQTPVKEINLYNTIGAGARTLVNSYPYAPAFSAAKRLDTLLVPYTVPTAASGTVIKLDYEIKNVNALSATRTVYVKVQ